MAYKANRLAGKKPLALNGCLVAFCLTICIGVAVPALSADSPAPDGVTLVDGQDPEILAAIEQARSTLPKFWVVQEQPTGGETNFCLKVKITDNNGTEHFWVHELERVDGKIFGKINNDPEIVQTVKLGQRIEVPAADISDWMYLRRRKMVGNYTLRALLKTMPAAQAAEYRKLLADE